MVSSGSVNPSMAHLILTSFLYLMTRSRKCNTLIAAAAAATTTSSPLSSHGIVNITVNMSDEQRLFHTLMMGYERSVRPTRRAADAVLVKLGITLTQIMDIDERNQIMTTNIWLDQEWTDEFFKWDPNQYGGLKKIRIPCRQIWIPDIVLYNSADDYTQGYMQALAMVSSDGTVFWPPIVKFRSTCKIDITWFPFDDQLCFLKFGSWTYDSTQIILTNRSENVDMVNYVDNGEWKLLSSWTVLSTLTYPCCAESYYDLKFYFHIRRRTLYYTYNVIIPCVMLSILTCLTFYLPTESGEKVSLGLTVLLAFSVFMLLIAESMPATSDSIPLIGIYFTLVMSLTGLSVFLAVILLNIHLYGSALKPVPLRLRSILFYHMAPFLRVRLHRGTRSEHQKRPRHSTVITPRRATTIYNAVFLNENEVFANGQPQHTFQSTTLNDTHIDTDPSLMSTMRSSSNSLGECKRLLTELNRLVLRPNEIQEEEMIVRDWQNVALVMDRCLLFLYFFLTLTLTVVTLVVAPLLKRVPVPPNYFQLNITRE